MSMDNEVILAALAYYNNSSKELKERVWGFFNSVDINRLVSFDEFVHFLHLSGYYRVIDPWIFTLLDVHRGRSLEFLEFLTFYYILQTCHRHVRCTYCGADTPAGLYFTCVDCFHDGKTTSDLCVPCYNGKRFWHYQSHDRLFHSYVLLRNEREVSHVTGSNMAASFQAPPNHQQMGFSYHQPINSGGSFQHYAAFFDQAPPPVYLNQVPTTIPGTSSGCCCKPLSKLSGLAYQAPLFQAPQNHQQMGFSYDQPVNSGGNFQHYSAFFNQVAPPAVSLNQVPTTNPGASSGRCCCRSNNNEPMPVAVVAYKPSLSKPEKRLEVAKKAGKIVVDCAAVVGAGAALLALL